MTNELLKTPTDLPTVEIPAQIRFMRVVGQPHNWGEFLKLAEGATTFIEKMGLLHGAYDVELGRRNYDVTKHAYVPYTEEDRHEFFFKIADGRLDSSFFRTPGIQWDNEPLYFVGFNKGTPYHRDSRTESEQRQVLARKAFDMLAANFFKMPSIRKDSHDRERKETEWIQDFVFGPLFPTVQAFFRPEADGKHVKIRNLMWHFSDRCPSEEVATSFLLKLAKFLWRCEYPRVSYFGDSPEDMARQEKEEQKILAMRAVVDGAKPWMIEVLNNLQQLTLLQETPHGLNEQCLAKLKEIAMRNKIGRYGRDERLVATLDEACYCNSSAAWLLKRHELMMREHGRLEAIRAAELKRAEAEQEVARLTKV